LFDLGLRERDRGRNLFDVERERINRRLERLFLFGRVVKRCLEPCYLVLKLGDLLVA
jgi:hypothetical protein